MSLGFQTDINQSVQLQKMAGCLETEEIFIPPANCVCGRVYCFHVVRPSERTNEQTNESVSVTFCFLNILKSH